MSNKRKPRSNYDSRLNQRALDLFRLGRQMLSRGVRHDSQEMNEVAVGIHRALALKPWQAFVLDIEMGDVKAESFPPHAEFALDQELHRRLVEATA
jgi:hypothetical protein